MIQLTENVFVEPKSYPVGSFVATPEGVLAVDAPMKPAKILEWRRAIAARGPLRYLVNTEHHGDHITANSLLGPDAVVASEWTRDHFLDGVRSSEAHREALRRKYPEDASLVEGYELRRPDIAYAGRMSIHMGGRTFRLFHAPGHTRGQTLVHAVEERVAFTGDNLVLEHPPFFHAASLWDWLASLDLLESLEVDWFVAGHGGPCRPEWVAGLRRVIERIIGEVERAKERGRSRAEAQAEVGYIDWPEFPHPQLERPHLERLQRESVGVIYDQLAERPDR